MSGIIGKEPFGKSGDVGAFASKGIDDNADANAITIDSSEQVGINTASPTSPLTIVQRADTSAIDFYGYDDMSSKKGSLSVNASGYTQLRSHSDRGMDFHSGETSASQFRWFADETEVMTLAADGKVGINTTTMNEYLNVNNNIWVTEGIYIRDHNGDYQLRASSSGSGSATLYIGNQSITKSSDVRIKENIVDTEMDAMGKLNALRVVDFTWNDPSDTSFNNKNARGKFTGLIAQEVIDVLPFCVNAVRDEETLTPQPNAKLPAIPDILYENDDQIPEGKKVGDVKEKGTPEMDQLWGMEYEYIVPVLIKAIQELSAKVTALEG